MGLNLGAGLPLLPGWRASHIGHDSLPGILTDLAKLGFVWVGGSNVEYVDFCSFSLVPRWEHDITQSVTGKRGRGLHPDRVTFL